MGFTVVIVLLLLAGGLVKFAPRFRQYLQLKEQDAAREMKIRDIERRTAETIEMERRFNTDVESVEAVARENHRYSPRETVYIFEDDGKSKATR